jgi:hypothetical protein
MGWAAPWGRRGAAARTLILEPATALAACQVLPPASPASVALNRLAYGMRAQDLAAFNALGATPDERYERRVDQQLNPATIDDSECEQLIANTRLKIRYGTLNQARPLELLGASTAELWTRANGGMAMNWSERIRPFNEVRVATWIRAVHSRRQLFEVLVDFWHNHFNTKRLAVSPAGRLPTGAMGAPIPASSTSSPTGTIPIPRPCWPCARRRGSRQRPTSPATSLV